jgi:hypothetical protein
MNAVEVIGLVYSLSPPWQRERSATNVHDGVETFDWRMSRERGCEEWMRWCAPIPIVRRPSERVCVNAPALI